jgi:hypothetical protein
MMVLIPINILLGK